MNNLTRYWLITFMILLLIHLAQCSNASIKIVNSEILSQGVSSVIYNGTLNQNFDDTVFSKGLNCRNNYIEIIQNRNYSHILFQYANMPDFNPLDVIIQITPNQNPAPTLQPINSSNFILLFNCQQPYTARTYWNQVRVNIPSENISFSFLLSCDPDNRYKQFEIGYILIAFINAAIIIGVAMHSYAWSIKINLKPLRFPLKWMPFLIFSIVGDVGVIFLLKFGTKDTNQAFDIIRFAGVTVSIPCIFICFNQLYYLIRKLQKPVYKFIKKCDIISLISTLIVGVFGYLYENWIFYDAMAICFCVASIKLFHFNSLKQAFSTMTIMFTSVTVLAIILHYILPRSYNDYAGELSSPLFIQVPDLIENLYKKCSWLPTQDVIIPGVTLSYLRVYDQNKGSKYGGVYTITGNLTFITSTIIWIGLQYVYPFSVPFSLITYPFLMLAIFLISWKRGEWKDLYTGEFIQELSMIDPESLDENRKSFKDHINHDSLENLFFPKEGQPGYSSIISDQP